MNQVNQIYSNDIEDLAKGSDFTPLVSIYSPNPTIKIVMISASNLPSAYFVSPSLVQLANQVVRKFELQPSQVIWIEQTFAKGKTPSCAGFNLIHFDWLDGQATSPYRLPIYEDWYLFWFNDNFSQIFSDDLDSKIHQSPRCENSVCRR